jgi:ABC-type cobalamin/Fe3+-siderophores transport system ATPase subunit
MRYLYFEIENFKGIEKIKLELDKTPDQKVFTLVGLNESGKTTILEAINFFSYGSEKMEPVKLNNYAINNYHSLIPMSMRDNFNGKVKVAVKVQPNEFDEKAIKSYAIKELGLKYFADVGPFKVTQEYTFRDSTYVSNISKWSISLKGRKPKEKKIKDIAKSLDKDNWLKLVNHISKMLPRIIYFPNFLFDFPDRIYLDDVEIDKEKHKFYSAVVQDMLDSLGTGANIATHILDRAKSGKPDDKKNLNSLLLKMSRLVTEVVFGAWSEIFKRRVNKKISIIFDVDKKQNVYLEFNVIDSDGEYLVSDRSLGFRWFFVFFLLTHFRRYRKGASDNFIFLFDEPASNLHSSAQTQLLKSLERLAEKCSVIYTTHSHHLINPFWLEGAFVVVNSGLNYDLAIEEYNSKKTIINVQSYRKFATECPDQTSYFQPILDVLDYCPSKLEMIPNVVMTEGKNDYYVLNYLSSFLGIDIQILPCTGAESMNVFISLYLAWGRKFIIVLDSDKKGQKTQQKYIEDYGIKLENRVFTLKDINAIWNNHDFEHLFNKDELIAVQRRCYPDAIKYTKTQFNRAIQELLIKKEKVTLSDDTIGNFKNVFNFIIDKLGNA